MPLTSLQTLVNRAQSKRALMNVSADDLVVCFDAAIREQMRTIDTPWRLKKGTLRVFSDVLEYPVAADHEDLMFLDTQKAGNDYWEKARFQYTSIQQFYENPEDRNYLATIFDNGVKFLGVRYQSGMSMPASTPIDTAQSITGWTATGDASNFVLDQVNTKNSSYSIRFSVVNSTNVATVKKTLDSAVGTTNYQKRYYFVDVFLPSVPSTVTLKLLCDNSNYLSSTVTTQFAGQPLVANDWNTLAFDLNVATVTGTIGSSFTAQEIDFTSARSGIYNVGLSFLREWTLMDYRYYSIYNCQSANGTQPDLQFFTQDDGTYDLNSSLVGELEWADIVFYDGCLMALADVSRAGLQTSAIIANFSEKLAAAARAMNDKHPDEEPVIVTKRYEFGQDYNCPVNSPSQIYN